MWSDNNVLDGFVLGPIEGLTLSFISGMSSIFHHFSVVKKFGNGARRDGISRKRIVNLISEIAGNCAVN